MDRATIHKLDLGRQYRGFWEDGYFVEVIRDLRNPPDTDEWIEAEALRGYTRAVDRPALHAPDRLREVLLALAPRRRPWHYALVFKDSLVTGEFRTVIEALRERNVIVLGPSHLAGLGEALALPRFRHVRIHETEAMRHRGAALRELRAALSPRDVRASQPLLVLQAGSLAWWLMARLFPDFPEASFLDLGRVLDVWFPAVADKQPWFRFEKRQMVDAMGLGALYAG